MFNKVTQPVVDAFLDVVDCKQSAILCWRTVGQVGGQNPLGFNQREHQAEHHNPATGLGPGGEHAFHQQRRGKGHDSGEHAEGRRCCHPVGAVYHAANAVPVLLLFRVSALANDNRIVDHNAQHQDEAEDADHVQAGVDVGCVDQRHGAQEAHRYAQHHPEGEFDLQKQGQDDEDEQRTHGEVTHHHAQPALEIVGGVRPHGQRHVLREQRLLFLDVGFCGLGSIDNVLRADGEDFHAKRVLPVE